MPVASSARRDLISNFSVELLKISDNFIKWLMLEEIVEASAVEEDVVRTNCMELSLFSVTERRRPCWVTRLTYLCYRLSLRR